jgi:hypothetical protein
MPIVNGVNYAKTHAPSDGNWKLVPVSEVGGTMRMLYDSYTAVDATLQNDILNVGRLPKDSRVWDVQIATSAAFCTTVDVGFAYDDSSITDDVDLFLDNAGAAGIVSRGMLGGLGLGTIVSGVSATIPQVPITIAGEGIVQVTLLGSDPTATSILKVKVLYTID